MHTAWSWVLLSVSTCCPQGPQLLPGTGPGSHPSSQKAEHPLPPGSICTHTRTHSAVQYAHAHICARTHTQCSAYVHTHAHSQCSVRAHTHARTHSLAQETLALRGLMESAHLLDQTLDQLVRGPQVLRELALQEPGQQLSMNRAGTLSPVCVQQWQETAHRKERAHLLCIACNNVARLPPDPWLPGGGVDSLSPGGHSAKSGDILIATTGIQWMKTREAGNTPQYTGHPPQETYLAQISELSWVWTLT